MTNRVRCLYASVTIALVAAPAHAAYVFAPPVDGTIARRFEPTEERFGAGHRGIDYVIESGTKVRAIGAGRVSFAGPVPGGWAVSIAHDGGIVSTYSILSAVSVEESQVIETGEWVGSAGNSHAGAEGLHLGMKVGNVYVDPLDYLSPLDVSGAIHLAPLAQSHTFTEIAHECRETAVASNEVASNENVVVEVAGISSRTRGGKSSPLYTIEAAALGVPEDRIYEFSYAGIAGPDLHEPYLPAETEKDLRESANGLRDLLIAIAKEHPDAKVDVLAHSQGGLVVRAMLDRMTDDWDPRIPEIEHVVTFSSPHGGAPLAGEIDDLAEKTATGDFALDAAGWWADHGAPIPDPRSVAVRQLAPGSGFLNELAREDVAFGTRFLSIGMTHDVIVPPDRAVLEEHPARVLAPAGLNGHSKVVTAQAGRAIVLAFVRDAPLPCPNAWDVVGPWIGKGVSLLEGAADRAYSAFEEAVGKRIVGFGKLVGRLIRRT